jgi:hypothetical protein
MNGRLPEAMADVKSKILENLPPLLETFQAPKTHPISGKSLVNGAERIDDGAVRVKNNQPFVIAVHIFSPAILRGTLADLQLYQPQVSDPAPLRRPRTRLIRPAHPSRAPYQVVRLVNRAPAANLRPVGKIVVSPLATGLLHQLRESACRKNLIVYIVYIIYLIRRIA